MPDATTDASHDRALHATDSGGPRGIPARDSAARAARPGAGPHTAAARHLRHAPDTTTQEDHSGH